MNLCLCMATRWSALGLEKARLHLIGLGRRHPRHVHDELHHLLLPHDYAAAPLQGALLQWMVVLPGDPVPVPLHELGDGAALDSYAWPDEGHLVGQVQEASRPEALGHLELGRRLEKEDALGAAPR